MALFGNGKRAARAERDLANLRAALPAEVVQGLVVESPYIEVPRQSILPWRRTEIVESGPSAPTSPSSSKREGFLADIPWGGANEFNQGYTQIGGATDRKTLMEQLQMLYVTCPWSSACVDTIARFSSAGGMSIEPNDETNQRKETITLSKQAQKAQDLFDYVNPQQNFRQLMRGIFTDLLIYGDSFIEVVWALGEPIALYSLPSPDMLIDADEHGEVNFYVQRTDTNRRAKFEPNQVIHIKFDSPRGGLYGLGPTEKTVHSITTWIFTEGLLKALAKKGNPPNIAIAWDINLSDNDIKVLEQKHNSRNLGPDNIGNPIRTRGQTTIHEMAQNKIDEYNSVKAVCRDEICGGYGTPPAMVTIIESGNLGGGTGTSQFKSFKVNTCGPVQELVLEAFTFAILRQGFGVEDYGCTFGDIDWRDDKVIEEISHMRVADGRWTPNRGRDEIGEPPVDGGDDAIIILSRDVVPLADIAAASKANIAKAGAPVAELGADAKPPPVDGPPAIPKPEPDGKPPAHAKDQPKESWSGDRLLTESEAHSGAMVALFVPAKIAEALAVTDGEPAEDMHVTLAYLGDASDLENADDLAAVITAWALETPPIAAGLSGLGLFTPQGDDPPVTYASVDAPQLSGVRHRLVEQLKRSGFPPNTEHGFTPHVTLAYANVIVGAPQLSDSFMFGAVTLAIGGVRQTWPLTGSVIESMSEDELFEAFDADYRTRWAEAMADLK